MMIKNQLYHVSCHNMLCVMAIMCPLVGIGLCEAFKVCISILQYIRL